MQITTLRLATKDELLKCLYHIEERKFVLATRTGLEFLVEDGVKIKRLENKAERSATVVSHDALFVRRQMLKKSRPFFYIQEVTADSDGAIRGYSCGNAKLEWEIHPGAHFGELRGHTRDVVQLVRGPSQTTGSSPSILSCGLDGLAFSWNIDVREKIAVYDRFPTEPENRVPATSVVYIDNLSFAGKESIKAVGVGYADGVVCIFDYAEGKLLLSIERNKDVSFKANEAVVDPSKLRSVPRWKHSVRGLYWSNIYQVIFASIGDEGVFGYDPASSDPQERIAHNPMNCAYLRQMGPIPELGVGEEGVAAFIATDGRVMLMRPTYSAAKCEGHFIPICTAFSIYENPPTSTFIIDMGQPTGRCLVIGCQKTVNIIAFSAMSNLLIHGNSEVVTESVGSSTHKINLEVDSELTDKNRYLSLIPEPLPNEIRYKLAEKEREIGLKTEGSKEQLERILEQFKDIKTGKVMKVKKIRKIEVPEEESEEKEEENGEVKERKMKIIEEEYEEEVKMEHEESEEDDEEDDPLADILDIKRFRKILKVITPEGVCPKDVLNTSISQIEDSLELLKQISLLFKVKIPKIDVEGVSNLSDEQMEALDVASAVMNTAYPTVGIETETGVSTAESRQTMKVQDIPREELHPTQPTGNTTIVTGNQQMSNMPGMSYTVAGDTQPNQADLDDSNLPPYLRTQKVNPYANAYTGVATVTGAPVQQNLPFAPKANAYGADAYASVAYEGGSIQQRPVPSSNQHNSIPQPQVVQNTYSPNLLSSFNAFDILARIVARSIALFIKRAAIADTRLLVTFGGREAKDLAVSLGSADEDVSIVRAKFERQRKIIEARQSDEIKCIKDMFEEFRKKFLSNLPREKKTIAAKFEILRRSYNDKRCRIAKASADLLLTTMLKFFPRYSVIGNRWVIVPSAPKSYPVFNAYDMLQDKLCSVHPVITPNLDTRLLFGISNVNGVIKPSGLARSEDAFNKLYVITPLPPKFTLRDLMDKMPRGLHPHELAHLLFPLVCTLARLQSLPGESSTVVHRDIRPSTVFLTSNPEMSCEEFISSQYPTYDPNAPTYDNNGIQAKSWPVPKVPIPSIFHLGVVRNCVMDEPNELNSMYCAPEVMLGGMCECSDTWSIGILGIKLLLSQVGGSNTTRVARVAMPSGPLTPVSGGVCTCPSSVAGYLTDVAKLSGVYDRINLPLIDDIVSVCHIPVYGANLLKTSLPMQETSMSVNVNQNMDYDMNSYGGINAFVQQNATPEIMINAIESLLPNCDVGTHQFLKDCLAFNPRERPSPIKLAHHPWFREHGLKVL